MIVLPTKTRTCYYYYGIRVICDQPGNNTSSVSENVACKIHEIN